MPWYNYQQPHLANVALTFSKIRTAILEHAMATGMLHGMVLPIGVCVAWGAWLEEERAADAKKNAADAKTNQD